MLKPIQEFNGQARAIIDHVEPTVNGGLHPIKRVTGDRVEVLAHIFADGHDTVRAVLQHRPRGATSFSESELAALPNDEWRGQFAASHLGFYEFRVCAWVDRFVFWREGFLKKTDSGQAPEVELKIAHKLLLDAASRAGERDAQSLVNYAEFLVDANRGLAERVETARSERLFELARTYPDRSRETCTSWFPVIYEREKAKFSAWYEFFPRSWSTHPGQHGTLGEARRILPEIARMGFNIVYLPPIHPIGRTFRKGRNNALEAGPNDPGSPWAIGSHEGGHKSVHPQLGTIKDFQDFVWSAGEQHLEVALDIAFQCSPDHPYVKEHPQWFNWRPDGTIQYAENPPKKYQDIVPFDFETEDWQNLWIELRSVFFFWIEKGVKIFRVDNPHTKSFAFWEWCVQTVKEQHPDVIFLAEAFTRPKRTYSLAKIGFTQGYTYFTWRNGRDDLRAYVEELTQGSVREFFWPNFWPNTPDILHDYLVQGGRPAHISRLVLAATLSSNWGMYGPAYELIEHDPFPGKEEYNYNEKYEIKSWDWDRPGNIKSIITTVNRIRQENPALHRTNNIIFCDTENPALIAYAKQTEDRQNTILTVVSLDYKSPQAGLIHLPLEALNLPTDQPYRLYDLLPGPEVPRHDRSYLWRGPTNYVRLGPHPGMAHVFRIGPI